MLSNQQYKIISITETWCDETVTDAMLISPPGSSTVLPYTVYRKDRKNRVGGGVCVLLHESLSCCEVKLDVKYDNIEILALDIIQNNKIGCRFISVYRAPDRSNIIEAKLKANLLSECISELCNTPTPIICTGDFNLPSVDWVKFSCRIDGVSDVLLDSFLWNSLNQLVESPTRGKNVLDLVLCSHAISDCHECSDSAEPSEHI